MRFFSFQYNNDDKSEDFDEDEERLNFYFGVFWVVSSV